MLVDSVTYNWWRSIPVIGEDQYMKYYNTERLHSANSDETPVRLEQLFYRGAQKDERLAGESCIGVGSQQTKRVSYV